MVTEQALAGVKVVDFTWAATGPISTKCLADYGATVVKIESMKRLDIFRSARPYLDGKLGINRTAGFPVFSSSKRSFALDLNHPKGAEVIRRLIGWADLVVENFTPKTLERWNLGYDELKKINPDIVVLRASVQGQEGPAAQSVSFGGILSGLAGYYDVTGWPDRSPVVSGPAYTDFIAPWYVVTTALAALDYRKRTGKGQYIDFSQMEAAEQFMAPAILDYIVNGREKKREGNRCSYAAPHNAYRCQGEDRWCAIAVFNDEEWEAFCRIIGKPELAGDPKFATFNARKKNEDELDQLVEEWTAKLPAEEVMRLMQAAGVPAGVAQNGRDLVNDPQLNYRQHYWKLYHQEVGRDVSHEAISFRLSKTPHELRCAPCLGQDTEYICRELLGMADEEFVELLGDGVFQ